MKSPDNFGFRLRKALYSALRQAQDDSLKFRMTVWSS